MTTGQIQEIEIIRNINAEEFEATPSRGNQKGSPMNPLRAKAEQLVVGTGMLIQCRPHRSYKRRQEYCADAMAVSAGGVQRRRGTWNDFKFAIRHTDEGMIIFRIK